MKTISTFIIRLFVMTIVISTLSCSAARYRNNYLRIASITVDTVKLDSYLQALKAQMKAALKNEKGVLGYMALQDKNNPGQITIFETYASKEAYQLHIQTEHFKTYKRTVEDMVLELELTDVIPIGIRLKRKMR